MKNEFRNQNFTKTTLKAKFIVLPLVTISKKCIHRFSKLPHKMKKASWIKKLNKASSEFGVYMIMIRPLFQIW